jgi:hypothetical protein
MRSYLNKPELGKSDNYVYNAKFWIWGKDDQTGSMIIPHVNGYTASTDILFSH